MTNPLVSVVIPARDAESFVADAVHSVMRQTYRPFECIVVDDGSTDATSGVVSGLPKVTLIRHERARGVSAARNAGVRASTGSYLAFLDADDAWSPEKLRRQVEALDRAPEAGILLCGYQHVDATMSRTLGVVPGDGSMKRIVSWLCLEGNGPAFSSTALVRRSAFEAVGGFNEDLAICEDMYFVLSVARQFNVEALPESLAYYRTHRSQSHRDVLFQAANQRRMYPLLQETMGPAVIRRCDSNLAAHVGYKLVLRKRPRAALPWLRDAARIDVRSLMRLPPAVARRRLSRMVLAARHKDAVLPPR